MDHTKEEIILYDNKDKYDDVINKEEVYCAEVQQSGIDIRTVERL